MEISFFTNIEVLAWNLNVKSLRVTIKDLRRRTSVYYYFPMVISQRKQDTQQLRVNHTSPDFFFFFESVVVSRLLILYYPVVIFHGTSYTNSEVVITLYSHTEIKHKSY